MKHLPITWGLFNLLCGMVIAFGLISGLHTSIWKPEVKIITTTITRYPNSPPYETLPDPIEYNQAILLLQGMRASHIQALNWTFESDPGFCIADKEFQTWCIHAYDQLIEYVQRKGE